jgi:hypothetical protein
MYFHAGRFTFYRSIPDREFLHIKRRSNSVPENHFAARRDWLHRRQRQRKAEQQEHRSGWGRPAVHPQRSGLCQTPAAVAPTGHGQPARSLKLGAQQQRRNASNTRDGPQGFLARVGA